LTKYVGVKEKHHPKVMLSMYGRMCGTISESNNQIFLIAFPLHSTKLDQWDSGFMYT